MVACERKSMRKPKRRTLGADDEGVEDECVGEGDADASLSLHEGGGDDEDYFAGVGNARGMAGDSGGLWGAGARLLWLAGATRGEGEGTIAFVDAYRREGTSVVIYILL